MQQVPQGSPRPGARARMSRRGFAGLLAAGSAGAFGLISSGGTPFGAGRAQAQGGLAPVPNGVLGANFNDAARSFGFEELRAAGANWLRGFYVTDHADREKPPAEQPELKKLLEAADRGYGTVLSLKFQYKKPKLHIPKPGSEEMRAELARVDKILPAVLGRVEILTIGNEPFYETPKDERDHRLNEFYEAVAKHVLERANSFPGRKARVFMGALNALEDPAFRTEAADRWVRFAARTDGIEGVDIHPHVASLDQAQQYVHYVMERLGGKSFMATEFSLVQHWKDHLGDKVDAGYAKDNGLAAGATVVDAVRQTIRKAVPQEQWNRLLSTSPWYEQNKHYLRQQVEAFRGTGKLAFASYGIAQDQAMEDNFGPGKPPWLFNSLFASRTVQRGPDGLPGRGYGWIEDFRALQRDGDKRPIR